MNLVAPDQLEKLIAAHPGVAQARKEFLVEFLCDASADSVAATLDAAPPAEAAFIHACLGDLTPVL